jgi:deazaflavin-dependent oxidoreductase (nitroreductase family)
VTKRRLTTALTRYLVNPVVKPLVRARLLRGWAILETRGRKSGLARRTPVGDGLIGDTFWIVAEHGRKAGYVRNIEADPRVRVLVDGTWRTGTAHPLPDDDPIARQRQLPSLNARFVRLMGTDLLTIRIDLDPLPE